MPMTIDKMDARVDVGQRSGPNGSEADRSNGNPLNNEEFLKQLQPIVLKIVDDELDKRLRQAGVK